MTKNERTKINALLAGLLCLAMAGLWIYFSYQLISPKAVEFAVSVFFVFATLSVAAVMFAVATSDDMATSDDKRGNPS